MNIHPSTLPRLESCPGSFEAEKGLADTTGPEAESGSRVHAALRDLVTMQTLEMTAIDFELKAEHLAGKKKLTDRETFIVKWFGEIVRKVCQEHGGIAFFTKETPVSMPFAGVVLEGTPDIWLVFKDGSVHVFEYKSGHGEQDTADNHAQGQAYGVLVADTLKDAMPVTVHILAAGNTNGEAHTFTEYNPDDLEWIRANIRDTLAAVLKKNAPRTPGHNQCQYCKARGTDRCPETVEAVTKFADRTRDMESPDVVFGALEPEQKAAAVANCKLVMAVAKRILDAAKKALKADPAAIPGWEMAPGRKTRTIEDAGKAYELLADIGLLPSEFAECVTVKLSAVEAAVHASQKRCAETAGEKAPTKKAIKEQVNATLAPVIVWKTGAGSLKQSKAAD